MKPLLEYGSAYGHADAPIRILIAGDDPVVAQSTAAMIQTANPDWDVNYVYLSRRETIEKAGEMRPDIVVIDLKINGTDAIRALQEINSRTCFICIAPNRDFNSISAALKLGVSDYFIQPVPQAELLAAVQKSGDSILSKKQSAKDLLHLQERIETASRIIRKDYIKILMPNSAQDRRLMSYAHFLGVTEQPGFMLAVSCRKNPTFKLPETIIYRLSTQFELIGSSVQKGLAAAFVAAGPEDTDKRREVLLQLDRLLAQFQGKTEDIICGAGGIYAGAAEMRLSLLEALSALNYYESVDRDFRYCVVFDKAAMALPEEAGTGGEADLSARVSLDQAISYMEMNYHREMTLNEVASRVNLSPYYFSRIFKKYTGSNFSRFLLEIRIRNAKELLADKHNSIKKVAYQVGFNDPNYFSKVFHDVTGIKASEFKK